MDFEGEFPLRLCMNLDRRADRWRQAERIFDQASLPVNRFPAVDGQRVRRAFGMQASRYAVGLTKMLALRRARQSGSDTVFIFEDDVVLATDWRARLAEIELPQDWGIFMLGCQYIARPQPVLPGLVRVNAAVDNHAIGFRRCWYERIIRTLRHGREDARIWPNTASDRHLSALMKEVPTYAAWPNLAWQRPSWSDQTHSNNSLYDESGAQTCGLTHIEGLDEIWQPGAVVEVGAWLDAPEIAFIEHTLTPDMKVLEYGAGGSTLHFCDMVSEWHSVEHNEHQYRNIASTPGSAGAALHFVPPLWPQSDPFAPALPGQFVDYAFHGTKLGLTFDAVLIDGRARVDCALAVAPVMKRGAWLFFHDYFARDRYMRRAPELLSLYRMVKEFRRTSRTLAVFRRR